MIQVKPQVWHENGYRPITYAIYINGRFACYTKKCFCEAQKAAQMIYETIRRTTP